MTTATRPSHRRKHHTPTTSAFRPRPRVDSRHVTRSCSYVPSKRDSAYGAMMRRVWLTFAATGTLQPLGWHPISSAPNFPQHYTTAVLNTTVVSVVDLRADLCSWWASRGIGQGYWWTN